MGVQVNKGGPAQAATQVHKDALPTSIFSIGRYPSYQTIRYADVNLGQPVEVSREAGCSASQAAHGDDDVGDTKGIAFWNRCEMVHADVLHGRVTREPHGCMCRVRAYLRGIKRYILLAGMVPRRNRAMARGLAASESRPTGSNAASVVPCTSADRGATR